VQNINGFSAQSTQLYCGTSFVIISEMAKSTCFTGPDQTSHQSS